MLFVPLALAFAGFYCGKVIREYLQDEPAPQKLPEPGELSAPPPNPDQPAAEVALTTTVQTPEFERADAENNLSLYLAFGSLGLTIAGALLFPPLSLIGSGILIYASVPLFRRAQHAIFEEKKLRASILDSFAVVATLLTRFYVLAAASSVIFYAGRKLLLKTQDSSQKKLGAFFGEQQRTVWLVKDGVELATAIEQLRPGDIISVRAGQLVPIDGVIVDGTAAIDQHMLTGEAQPVHKSPGERVLAMTLILVGRIRVAVEQTGSATVAGQIEVALQHTADYRSTIEFRSEQLGDKSVLPLLALGGLALPTVGVQGAVAILSSNFSDNVRVAVPLAMINVLNNATKQRILIKDGRALELLPQIDTVLFDKTGTLTIELPHVEKTHCMPGFSEQEVVRYAASAEARQSHPIASAILQHAAMLKVPIATADKVQYNAGFGIAAEVAEQPVLVGSMRYMKASDIAMSSAIESQEVAAYELGHSLIYVAVGGVLAGMIELQPTVRREVQAVVKALQARGLALGIISGDHEIPTRRLARELGIERYFAQVLPADKAALVTKLQQAGHQVCFVGDGVNDSIALKTANVSISLHGATSMATDTAQVIFMDNSLEQLPELFALADRFTTTARNTVTIALAPAVVSIAGVFFFNLGILATIVLCNVSLLACVGNAMLPAWLPEKRRPKEQLDGPQQPAAPHQGSEDSAA